MAIGVTAVGLPGGVPSQAKVEPVPASGIPLRDLLLGHLATQWGSDAIETLFDGRDLRPEYAILVNGRNAMQIGGLDLLVEDGARVVITVLVAGG